MQIQKSSIVSYAVFVFALGIVLINLVSLIFPSLIITLIDETVDSNPYELGTWAIPVIVANIAILIFGILYYTKRLPNVVKNGINFILNFEVSRNVATIVVVGIVFGYVGLGFEDLAVDESKSLADFNRVKDEVENWPFGKGSSELFNLHVKNFLLKSSQFLFQNWRIVPFIVSISLVLLTYFFTVELTKKRFAGLVAMTVFLSSYTFQIFDTTASYENSWALLYLLSLYLIFKKWFLSPISYVASIFSKPLTIAYFPLTIFFLFLVDIPRRKKLFVLLSYGIIAIVAFVGIVGLEAELGIGVPTRNFTFDYDDFWSSFTIWSFQLRYDFLFLLFILPLIVALFLISRKGISHANAALMLIAGATIAMPLVAALSGYNLHPYRYIALIDFFAIGVGTLLIRRNQAACLNTV